MRQGLLGFDKQVYIDSGALLSMTIIIMCKQASAVTRTIWYLTVCIHYIRRGGLGWGVHSLLGSSESRKRALKGNALSFNSSTTETESVFHSLREWRWKKFLGLGIEAPLCLNLCWWLALVLWPVGYRWRSSADTSTSPLTILKRSTY